MADTQREGKQPYFDEEVQAATIGKGSHLLIHGGVPTGSLLARLKTCSSKLRKIM
jgi:hypothetical protein